MAQLILLPLSVHHHDRYLAPLLHSAVPHLVEMVSNHAQMQGSIVLYIFSLRLRLGCVLKWVFLAEVNVFF